MPSTVTLDKEDFRLLTWPRSQWSEITIHPQSLRTHCPLDNRQRQPRTDLDTKCVASHASIGDLEKLPLEIPHAVCCILDLQSLTNCRAVNWGARALVDCFPPYNSIIQYCPDAIRALLSTNMAIHLTAQNIFETLCTQACWTSGCTEFGPFLDLFTGRRYCYTCVAYSDDLLSMTASAAKRELSLDSKTMRSLPTLLSLPGKYGDNEKTFRRRISLVRMLSTAAAAAGSRQQEESTASHRRSETHEGRLRFLPRPGLPTPQFSRQFLQKFDTHRENPYRFMAMIRFPSLDRGTSAVDWGSSCQACRLGPRDIKRGYYNWNSAYSAAGYMEHFQNCELSQIAQRALPKYIVPAGENQAMSDAKVLGFISNYMF